MRLLFTSRKRTGAFIMRGEQIAAQRPEWRAIVDPSAEMISGYNALVVIKDVDDEILAAARTHHVPIIYDALDFWPQVKSPFLPPSKAQRLRSGDGVGALFRAHFARLTPDLIVCVTQRMAEDLATFGPPAVVIRHHADPRLPDAAAYRTSRPVNDAKRVLYFGKSSFLREWAQIITEACRENGAEFAACDVGNSAYVSPPFADAMIAVRGGRDGCWISRNWKSNVKAATAAQLGLPLIAWPEAAYRETAPEAYWFTDRKELSEGIAAALGPDARRAVRRYTPADAALSYETAIETYLSEKLVHA